MAPVWINVKSALPELQSMQIQRCKVEPDRTWEEFFILNNVLQFNTALHAITSKKGNKAHGNDRILTTSSLFRRDFFTVRIIRRRGTATASATSTPSSTIGRARGTAIRGRQGRARSLISISSLLVHARQRGEASSNGAAAAGPVVANAATAHRAIPPQQRARRGRESPALASTDREVVVVHENHQPGPSAPATAIQTVGRGRGRGGSHRGARRPNNMGGRSSANDGATVPSVDRGGTTSRLSSNRASPSTPRVPSSTSSVACNSRYPEEYLLVGASGQQNPQNNITPRDQARRNYAETIASEDENPENAHALPASNSRKDVFLQLAARVPSSDYDVFYNELQGLRSLPKDSYWRWSRKTPTIAHFLQMVLRAN